MKAVYDCSDIEGGILNIEIEFGTDIGESSELCFEDDLEDYWVNIICNNSGEQYQVNVYLYDEDNNIYKAVLYKYYEKTGHRDEPLDECFLEIIN